MQYILSEEEYNSLLERAERGRKMPPDKDLQRLCTTIADTMPVKWGWSKPDEPRPWGCYMSQPNRDWYCDKCPVAGICPAPKHWSK